MSMRWKSQQIGYEDVPLHVHDIVRHDKEFGMVGWILVLVLIPLHFVGAAIAVFVAQWVFTSLDQMTVALLAAVTYGVCVLSLGMEKLYRKMCRMEMHALVLHDEILQIKDHQERLK
jgi:hypothetical protein